MCMCMCVVSVLIPDRIIISAVDGINDPQNLGGLVRAVGGLGGSGVVVSERLIIPS